MLEERAKTTQRKAYIQEAVLGTIGATGLVAWMTLAPNTMQLIPEFLGNKYKFAYQARSAASRLAAKGYVRFVERGGAKYIEITSAGERALALQQEKIALKNKVRRRWDKLWRMIIFDIPEKRRNTRLRLRTLMQEIGLYRLQDSVWIFPYDCEEILTLIKAELRVGKDVLYVIATQIENDKRIKRHFNLTS